MRFEIAVLTLFFFSRDFSVTNVDYTRESESDSDRDDIVGRRFFCAAWRCGDEHDVHPDADEVTVATTTTTTDTAAADNDKHYNYNDISIDDDDDDDDDNTHSSSDRNDVADGCEAVNAAAERRARRRDARGGHSCDRIAKVGKVGKDHGDADKGCRRRRSRRGDASFG
jgi:hypothetical protein